MESDVSAEPAHRTAQEKHAAGDLGDCGKGSGVDIIRPTKITGWRGRQAAKGRSCVAGGGRHGRGAAGVEQRAAERRRGQQVREDLRVLWFVD